MHRDEGADGLLARWRAGRAVVPVVALPAGDAAPVVLGVALGTDGLPAEPCGACGGIIFIKPWPLPLAGEGWRCLTCMPADPDVWHHAHAHGPMPRAAANAVAAAAAATAAVEDRAAFYVRAQREALEALAMPDPDLDEERLVMAGFRADGGGAT